jgi:hypothetical protein
MLLAQSYTRESTIPCDFTPIAQFKAPYLEEVAIRKGIVDNTADFNDLFDELKKYLDLCRNSSTTLAMLDEGIDTLWHEFILFTAEYRHFCETLIGKMIDHRPNTSHTPTRIGSALAFFEAYDRIFGKLPPIWSVRNSGQFPLHPDDESRERLDGFNCGGTDCGGNCDAS